MVWPEPGRAWRAWRPMRGARLIVLPTVCFLSLARARRSSRRPWPSAPP